MYLPNACFPLTLLSQKRALFQLLYTEPARFPTLLGVRLSCKPFRRRFELPIFRNDASDTCVEVVLCSELYIAHFQLYRDSFIISSKSSGPMGSAECAEQSTLTDVPI